MTDLGLSIREIASAFMVLFAIIDITGSTPIILDLRSQGKKIEAGKAALGALVLFMVFLFAGEWTLALFGVEIYEFATAGALVLFALALEMILGIEIFKYDDSPSGSPTIVPLIFPLIAGAGSLTTMLSLRAEFAAINIIIAVILNMFVVYVVLRSTSKIERALGKGTIYALRKFFGIILLAMSVKLFATNIIKILH
ncbi:MAG: MarC family protein [Bacteroidales bacterium]|nr:MarC family protein [Bacteroidales bacterium]